MTLFFNWLSKPWQNDEAEHRTLEYWENKLKQAKTPLDYGQFLWSKLGLYDSARLLYRIFLQRGLPDHLFGNQGEIETLANSLASNEKPEIARLLRFFQFHTQPPSDYVLTWCQRLMELERQAALIVQALEFLQKCLRWGRYALNQSTDEDYRRALEAQLMETETHRQDFESMYVQCVSQVAIM
jgi:hypothetical protein